MLSFLWLKGFELMKKIFEKLLNKFLNINKLTLPTVGEPYKGFTTFLSL